MDERVVPEERHPADEPEHGGEPELDEEGEERVVRDPCFLHGRVEALRPLLRRHRHHEHRQYLYTAIVGFRVGNPKQTLLGSKVRYRKT